MLSLLSIVCTVPHGSLVSVSQAYRIGPRSSLPPLVGDDIGEALLGQHAKEWRYLAERSRRVVVTYATNITGYPFVNRLYAISQLVVM